MTEQTKQVPKRRFKEFENSMPWEQLELREVLKINSGRDYKHLDPGDIPVYGTGGYMLSVNDKLSVVDGIGIGRKGTIDKPQYLKAPFWTVDTLFFMTPLSNYDIHFLFSLSQNIKWRQLDESTGVPSLSKVVIEKVVRNFPSYEEQKRIGTFFKHLDELITFHQRKLEKVKALKNAYLTEMFPSEGELVPKRRFAGFTQDWEVKNLGELTGNFEYGLNASAILFDGINKYIRITDIDDQTRVFNQIALTSPDANLSKAENYILKKGDILFARTGASVGKTYRYRESDGKVYYAGFLIRARIDSQFDTEFVFQNTLTKQYNNFVRITSQRSGQPGINAQEYSQFNLMVPELDEQRKIGNFFKQLDQLIQSHQKKLDKLQNLKKAYLHEMFV